jgi:hypothetical protein
MKDMSGDMAQYMYFSKQSSGAPLRWTYAPRPRGHDNIALDNQNISEGIHNHCATCKPHVILALRWVEIKIAILGVCAGFTEVHTLPLNLLI